MTSITVTAANGEKITLQVGDILVDEFDCTAVQNIGGRFGAAAKLNGPEFFTVSTHDTAEAAWAAAGAAWDECWA